MARVGLQVHSLVSLCIDNVVRDLSIYLNCGVSYLPSHIKNRMLRKFTSSAYYWRNVDFKSALTALVHVGTERVDLSLADVDDKVLDILSKCENLSEVHFTKYLEEAITYEGLLKFAATFKNLSSLQLSDFPLVDDEVMEILVKNCRKLTALDLNKCENITDVGIYHVATLENLIWLTLSSTQVTNKGIEMLVNGPSGSKLKELRLANCKYINSAVLKTIAKKCPKIEVLVFYNMQFNDCDDDSSSLFQDKLLKNLKQVNWTVQW